MTLYFQATLGLANNFNSTIGCLTRYKNAELLRDSIMLYCSSPKEKNDTICALDYLLRAAELKAI